MKGDGQSRVAYELACYGLSRGDDVTLLADHVSVELIDRGAQWTPIRPLCKRPQLIKGWHFAKLVDRHMKQHSNRYDVTHGFGYVMTHPHTISNAQFVHASWAASPVHAAKVQRNLYGVYQWLYSRLNTIWEKKAYASARMVVASSRRVRGQLLGIGVPGERIRVIHNGVDLKEFAPGFVNRGNLGLPEDVQLALFVGDIRTPRKNLDTVLKALLELPELHLAVVGDILRSPFPAMAARNGLGQRVHFLGFRNDVASIMKGCDLFVFPSRYEACSLVILEALASGLPVVTAETAGGAEILEKGTGVVLQNPDDLEELVRALRMAFENIERLKCMGKAARSLAEMYDWQTMASAHFEAYALAASL